MKLHSIVHGLGSSALVAILVVITGTSSKATSPTVLSGPTAVGHAEYDVPDYGHSTLSFSAHTKHDGSVTGSLSFEGTALFDPRGGSPWPFDGSFVAQVMEMLVVDDTAYLYCRITKGDGAFAGFTPEVALYYPVLIRVVDNGEGTMASPDHVSAVFIQGDYFASYLGPGQLPPRSLVKAYLDEMITWNSLQSWNLLHPVDRGNIQVLP